MEQLNNINNKNSSKNETDPNFNFLHERLIQMIESHAFVPLSQYCAGNLKKTDYDKVLSNEEYNTIKNIFSNLRSHYIDQVREETKNFCEKYNLKEKLEMKSEVFLYSLMMAELGISVEDLEEIEEMNNLENDESSLLKYYTNKFTRERNIDLECENERLKEELKELKEKNELGFN